MGTASHRAGLQRIQLQHLIRMISLVPRHINSLASRPQAQGVLDITSRCANPASLERKEPSAPHVEM